MDGGIRTKTRAVTGRAIPRPSPYPTDRYPSTRYPNTRGTYRYGSVAFDNGYNDGQDKGREDARDRDSYDPNRHRRYRNADRGYEGRYGSKDEYREIYRDGFLAGYDSRTAGRVRVAADSISRGLSRAGD